MADIREGHSNGEAAFAVDTHNRVTYWDQGAAKLLGLETTDALDRCLDEVLTAWDESGNRFQVGNGSLHEMARRGEDICGFAIKIARSDGSPLRVYSSVEVLHPGNNGAHQLLFRLRPDRRRPRENSELQQMIQQAVALLGESAGSNRVSSAILDSRPCLTSRQAEVLELLSQGMQCDDIAGELNLSVCTIRRHVQIAMEKLGAHTQAEAVAKSIRHNLI